MYNVMSKKAEEFIDHEEIEECLAYAEDNKNNEACIDAILEKAKQMKGITHKEALVLLDCEMRRFMNLLKRSKKSFTATVLLCLLRCICQTTVSMAANTVLII